MIDWIQLLSRNSIPYREERHNIYVHCIWCGAADQGMHLGISTRGAGWGCWRNKRHRGKSYIRLLAALLRISDAQARALLGIRGEALLPDNDLRTRFSAVRSADRCARLRWVCARA